MHDAVIVKKHAAKSLSETKAQRSQPPEDAEVVHSETASLEAVSADVRVWFFCYLFQKTLSAVLSFSEIWILTLRERRKTDFSESQ